MAGGATPQDSLVKGSESGSLPVQTANMIFHHQLHILLCKITLS